MRQRLHGVLVYGGLICLFVSRIVARVPTRLGESVGEQKKAGAGTLIKSNEFVMTRGEA